MTTFSRELKVENQNRSTITSAEEDSKVSVIESIFAGIGSGLISIPKGVFSLGATLMDLGAGTNKAAEVERWFDDLTTLDEKAAATTAGKITELLINIGIPGGIGFKVGKTLARKALLSKRAGNYFKVGDGKELANAAKKASELNTKGRAARFMAGAVSGGIAEGVFIGDVEKIGTFGDLLGGPTQIDRGDERDPARDIINRIKFGTEGALFTGIVGATSKTLKALVRRDEVLSEADNAIDKILDFFRKGLTPAGKKGTQYFRPERQTIGLKRADIKNAQRIVRDLNLNIDGMFPFIKRTFAQNKLGGRQYFLKLLNDALIDGAPRYVKASGKQPAKVVFDKITKAHKKKIMDFMKKSNNDIKVDTTKLANIFTNLDLMRFGWGRMFSDLAATMSEKQVQKMLKPGSLKKFKDLFGSKFKNYLSATYDVFENKSLIPLLNYTPSRQVLDKFIKSLREAYGKNRKGQYKLSYEEAETYAQQVKKTAQAPKRFDQDARVNLPTFYTAKSLAAIKKLPTYVKKQPGEVELGAGKLTPQKEKIIKEFLGKTENPMDTILASTEKLSQVTRGNQFMTNLVTTSQEAIKKGSRGVLYANRDQLYKVADDLKAKGELFNVNNYRKINIKKSEQAGLFHQANGKYARREIADAIEDAAGNNLDVPNTGIVNNALYQNLVLLPKAAAQMAKTILSPVTHVRNLVSAGAFAAANGIIPFLHFNPKMMYNTFKTLDVALPGSRAEVEAYEELVRLGVVNTNVSLGDLRGLLKDVDFGAKFTAERGLRGITGTLSKLKKWTEDMYTAEDDFWKIGTFTVEQARLGRAFASKGVKEGMKVKNYAGELVDYGDDFLKEEAAHIVRNQVPNYDYVSEFVRSLRRWPVGNFMAFPAEIMRTSVNIVRRGLDELTYTMKVGGKEVRPLASIGMQRLIGMGLTTAAVPYGAVKLGQTLYDISDEQLEAIRRYVPPWAKNSTIVPVKNEDGSFSAIDFSRANAYDLLVRPIQTVINEVAAGEKDNDGIMNDFIMGTIKSFGSIMQPFVTESIWTEAVMDVIPIMGRGGVTIDGVKVYNPKDTPGTIAKEIFLHLGKAQAPFSWQQLERLDYAVGPFDSVQLLRGVPGKYDPRGETYELGPELLGFLGMRPAKINVERSLNFKISKYQKGKTNAGQLFTTRVLKGGPIDAAEVVDAYINANRAMFGVQQDMKLDIDAARTLDLRNVELGTVFSQRMSNKEFNQLDAGFFKPYTVGKGVQDRIMDISRDIGIRNPFFAALPMLVRIDNLLNRLRLLKGQKFPQIINPFREVEQIQEPATIQKISNVQGDVTTNLQSNIMPPPGSAPASTNLASFSGQVGPDGLKPSERAFLPPDEQQYYREKRRIG